MTRKDYIALAAVLATQRPTNLSIDDCYSMRQWEHDVRAVSIALRVDNPRFDYVRFAKAAGLENL